MKYSVAKFLNNGTVCRIVAQFIFWVLAFGAMTGLFLYIFSVLGLGNT